MTWFSRPATFQESVARTGFFTSVAAYAVFAAADALRPGFVSRFLSVHAFLLVAALFAAWLLALGARADGAWKPAKAWMIAGLASAGAFFAAWTSVGPGDDRLPLSLLSAAAALAAAHLIRHTLD